MSWGLSHPAHTHMTVTQCAHTHTHSQVHTHKITRNAIQHGCHVLKWHMTIWVSNTSGLEILQFTNISHHVSHPTALFFWLSYDELSLLIYTFQALTNLTNNGVQKWTYCAHITREFCHFFWKPLRFPSYLKWCIVFDCILWWYFYFIFL